MYASLYVQVAIDDYVIRQEILRERRKQRILRQQKASVQKAPTLAREGGQSSESAMNTNSEIAQGIPHDLQISTFGDRRERGPEFWDSHLFFLPEAIIVRMYPHYQIHYNR